MRKSIVLTSILSILSISAFADITGSSNCTEGVLGTSANGSTANIDANWNPNTINIKWYNGDTQLTQTSCQYDTTIVLPTQPSKPGYTFNGWRLRTTPAAPNCSTIASSSTCNSTNGCHWRYDSVQWRESEFAGCYVSTPAETSGYNSCSEIMDEGTCLGIHYEDSHMCVWRNGACHLDYDYGLAVDLPAQSWCQEAIDGLSGDCGWHPDWNTRCNCDE